MRALLQDGQKEYKNWVLSLSEDPRSPTPIELLTDRRLSYEIQGTPPLEPATYASKYDMARGLLEVVEQVEACRLSHDRWPGVWDALALAHFEVICPRKANGDWNPNRVEHYVYDLTHAQSGSLAYRHRIYGPVTLYRTGKESVEPFFQTKPCVLGEYEESIGSRQEIAGSSVALQCTKALYAKNDGTGPVRGFTTTKRYPGFRKKLPAPGTIRRFVNLWQQLKRTYDLAGIPFDGLVELLPAEFDSWQES